MSASARHSIMTIEDFLAWEARQEIKFEFDGYEPVAMAGGSLNHARIQRNLAAAFTNRLRNSPCEFVGSDIKLLSANRSRYPDGQVICGPNDGRASFTTSPVILFEIVSPGDEKRDRVEKVSEYALIPSVTTYVILDQDQVAAQLFTRIGDSWSPAPIGRNAALTFTHPALEIPLAELYEGTGL